MKTLLILIVAMAVLPFVVEIAPASAEGEGSVERRVRSFRPLDVSSESVTKAQPAEPSRVVRSVHAERIEKNKQRLRHLFDTGKLKHLLSDKELRALELVESEGVNGKIGDKHLGEDPNLWAWGILQIRKCYVDDVNALCGTNIYASDCLWDVELSRMVTQAYMNRYGRKRSFEDRARIHNGGPNGWDARYTHVYAKTNHYWGKVKRKLHVVVAAK